MNDLIAPWTFEVVGPLLWLGLAAFFAVSSRRQGDLTLATLVFIGGTTMWWQEWYGDWGSYVLYHPHLHLIPGYDLPFTSPNKPWAVIPAYGWFYSLVYFPVIAAARRIQVRRPNVATWKILVLLAFPVYYLWDLVIEGGASLLGLWSYVDYAGPAITSDNGNFPLLYPVIFFAAMMTLTAVMIAAKRGDGVPRVEAWARVDRLAGAKRAWARVVVWIVTMNLCYLTFILPSALIRYFFLAHSSLVT